MKFRLDLVVGALKALKGPLLRLVSRRERMKHRIRRDIQRILDEHRPRQES